MLTGIKNVFDRHRRKGLAHKACQAALRGDFLSALGYLDQGGYVNFIGHAYTYSESKIDATVAHQALERGNMTAFTALLERGLDANLTLKEDKKSLLILALEKGNAEAALLLVARGASLDVRTPALETPLDLARKKNLSSVIQAIEDKLQSQQQKALPPAETAPQTLALEADTAALSPLVLKKSALQL